MGTQRKLVLNAGLQELCYTMVLWHTSALKWKHSDLMYKSISRKQRQEPFPYICSALLCSHHRVNSADMYSNHFYSEMYLSHEKMNLILRLHLSHLCSLCSDDAPFLTKLLEGKIEEWRCHCFFFLLCILILWYNTIKNQITARRQINGKNLWFFV